jgi:hypothetical protein
MLSIPRTVTGRPHRTAGTVCRAPKTTPTAAQVNTAPAATVNGAPRRSRADAADSDYGQDGVLDIAATLMMTAMTMMTPPMIAPHIAHFLASSAAVCASAYWPCAHKPET